MIKSVFKRWSKLYVCLLLLINVILAVINIIVLSCEFPSVVSKPYYFDYYGAIVGILSFLITILMGWNIGSVVDFKEREQRIDERSKQIEIKSKEVRELDERLKEFEREYYDRIKKVESSFIETSFNIYHAKPDDTIIAIVIHGLEVVLWLAQMGDFDKACEVFLLVYKGIKKRKPLTIPAAYFKDLLGLIYNVGKCEKIKEMPEFDDLRDMFNIPWDDLNKYNSNEE